MFGRLGGPWSFSRLPVCPVGAGPPLGAVLETAPVTGLALLNVTPFTYKMRTLISYNGIASYQVPGKDSYLLCLWPQLKESVHILASCVRINSICSH